MHAKSTLSRASGLSRSSRLAQPGARGNGMLERGPGNRALRKGLVPLRTLSTSHSNRSSQLDFQQFANIINGQPRFVVGDHFASSRNPRTGEQLWKLPKATTKDVDEAVEAGKAAFPGWAELPVERRAQLVEEFAQAFQDQKESFVDLLATETGKPMWLASVEIDEVANQMRYHAKLRTPELVEKNDTRTIVTRYVPFGVTAAICPWNFPLILANSKFAPSLVAGNCIIMKPSPFTPYSLLKFVELAQQIFPPGVVQALAGGDDVGPLLVDHPGIAKLSFTGSIKTGKKIMSEAAKTLKRVTLELGGNDPSIVFPDVDVEATAVEVAKGALVNSGQICVGTKRIYVHADIYDRFLAALVAAVQKTPLTLEDNQSGVLGPVQNELQHAVVKGFVDDCVDKGYRFALGGPESVLSQGFYMEPMVIDNPPDDSMIAAEEQFGPIVPLMKWTDEAEVIRRANESNTGLGACVWTKDVAHAEAVADKLEAGSVWINSHEKLVVEANFSGHKESGIGGELGPQALMHWVQPKVTHLYR